jgi:Ca2+-binding RTX toxin-like protein
MRVDAPCFDQKLRDIETIESLSGETRLVTIKFGYAVDIGAPDKHAGNTDSYQEGIIQGPENVIHLPLEVLQGSTYDGTNPQSIQRLIAHEMTHVWQDALQIKHDPNTDYDFFDNNIQQKESMPSGIPDDADQGTLGVDALAGANCAMNNYGEVPDSAYGGKLGTGPVRYYQKINGVQTLIDIENSAGPRPNKPIGNEIDKSITTVDTATKEITPLVLDLNHNGFIDTVNLESTAAVHFDHNQDTFAEATAWIGSGDGFLAIDLNNDGIVNNGSELFGDQTGQVNGFQTLSQYDSNGDRLITAEDAAWHQLRVWIDSYSDGHSEESELYSMSDLGITQFDLSYSNVDLNSNGNTIKETSSFLQNGNIHIISDVYFLVDKVNTIYQGDFSNSNLQERLLVNSRGYGELPALYIASALDKNDAGSLLKLLQNFVADNANQLFDGDVSDLDAVKAIMFRWAGVENVAAGSRGKYVDAQKLAFLEKLTGEPFRQHEIESNPRPDAGRDLTQAFDMAQNAFFARFEVQVGHTEMFVGSNIQYNPATDKIEGITGLSQIGLDGYEAQALVMSSTAERAAFWGNVVRVIDAGIGIGNLSFGDDAALRDAIFDSDPVLNLDAIVGTLVYERFRQEFTGTAGADTLLGTPGDDSIFGSDGDDGLSGYGGADTLDGGYGNDTLQGGIDDDLLEGGSGNDLYIYNLGDGDDVIAEGSGSDTIGLGAGITAADLIFTRIGKDDLLININSSSNAGSILLRDQFVSFKNVETLLFSDSTTFDMTTINLTLLGSGANDRLHGVQTGGGINDIIYGGGGHDVVYGHAGNDTIYGEGGNDIIDGGTGNNIVYGGEGNDTIYAEGGNDSLTGGAGDDLVDGGSGTNAFYFTSGHDIYKAAFGTDTIYLPTGFTSTSTVYYRIGVDLKIVLDADNSITISKHYMSGQAIETLVFDGGPTLSLSSVTVLLQGDDNNNTLNGTANADVFYGMGGNDTLNGGPGNDLLYGGTGNDFIYGNDGDDYIDGGAGNDTANGGAGNDNFYYLSGHDVYDDGGTGTEEIIIDAAWNLSDLEFRREATAPNDVVIQITAGNSITLLGGFYNNSGNGFETLKFADNSIFDLKAHDYTTYGTSGNNNISGISRATSLNDTIYAMEGNDTVNAGLGNNTVYAGAGNDYVSGGDGDDLFYGDEGDDTLTASDGHNTLYGGDGNDTLTGGDDVDILSGDAGNDTLIGKDGNDIYRYLSGDDIFSENGGDGVDVIEMAAGYTSNDLTFKRYSTDPTDLVIEISAGNSIRLDSQFFGTRTGIDTIKFADNTTINLFTQQFTTYGTGNTDSISGLVYNASVNDTIYAYEANDTIYAGAGDDAVDGGGGNDTINGGAGHDVLSGGQGSDIINGEDGNDLLSGNEGDDTLSGGAGNDTYLYQTGNDIFYDAASGADVIVLTSGISLANLTFTRYSTQASAAVIAIDGTNSLTINSMFQSAGYGIETLQFSDNSTLNLLNQQYTTYGTINNDTIAGITVGGSINDIIYGLGGNDTINAGTGNDVLDGGAGNDTLNGAAGDDVFVYSSGLDTIIESAGNDILRLTGATTINNITTSQSASNATIIINSGIDQIVLQNQHSTNASFHVETIQFADGFQTTLEDHLLWVRGTTGNDTMTGTANHDTLIGLAGNDTITAGDGNDNIHGGIGTDILYGGIGNDLLHGGDGNDTIYGQAGNDTLVGGTGADIFVFQAATAFSASDVIQDYHASESDAINVSDLLSGYSSGTSNIDDFVSFTNNSGNSIMAVDRDGAGAAYSFSNVATINSVTNMDAHDLLNNGHLVV